MESAGHEVILVDIIGISSLNGLLKLYEGKIHVIGEV